MSLVGVVACSKLKASAPCAALELYRGRTFRAAVELLRGRGCTRFVVLSAEHGAVGGKQIVAPYEKSLLGLPAAERRAWASRARVGLAGLVGSDDVLAILPADYARALEGLPRGERLYAGLSQGRLYSALRAELAS